MMVVAANALPYGLRDVKLTPIDGTGTLGTPQDLPASRTLSFTESEDYTELRGDDGVITARGNGAGVDWDLEAGGISFEVWKILSGAALTIDAGTTKKTIRKKSTQARPFFKAEGQAISDSGGDFHVVLYRCRATGDLTGELSDGNFWLTGASGTAFPTSQPAVAPASGTDDNVLYDFIQNSTETAIATS